MVQMRSLLALAIVLVAAMVVQAEDGLSVDLLPVLDTQNPRFIFRINNQTPRTLEWYGLGQQNNYLSVLTPDGAITSGAVTLAPLAGTQGPKQTIQPGTLAEFPVTLNELAAILGTETSGVSRVYWQFESARSGEVRTLLPAARQAKVAPASSLPRPAAELVDFLTDMNRGSDKVSYYFERTSGVDRLEEGVDAVANGIRVFNNSAQAMFGAEAKTQPLDLDVADMLAGLQKATVDYSAYFEESTVSFGQWRVKMGRAGNRWIIAMSNFPLRTRPTETSLRSKATDTKRVAMDMYRKKYPTYAEALATGSKALDRKFMLTLFAATVTAAPSTQPAILVP